MGLQSLYAACGAMPIQPATPLEGAWRRIVARMVTQTRARFPNPVELAEAAGVLVMESAAVHEVAWSDSFIAYRPNPCPRDVGLLVHFGLAGALLRRTGLVFCLSDQWAMCFETAVPARLVLRNGVRAMVLVQQHAPRWMIRAQALAVGASW